MPFYRFDHPDGTSSWAHVLCDYPVGGVMAGAPVTCDKPMCARHRTRVGENLDHCPNHKPKEPSMTKRATDEPSTPEQEVKEPPTGEAPDQAPSDQGDGASGTEKEAEDERDDDAVGGGD